MEKLDLHTPDLTSANIDRIAALFPNCVTETQGPDGSIQRAIDFDLLRQELSPDLVEGPQERYRLDWPGKREALALANQPIDKTLRPCREESVDFEGTRNLYIEGDNLDALKLLQETYLGKVKMIYIDPPYNTGNDFIYDDNFSMRKEEYDLLSGNVDEERNAMFDEEKWRQNSSSNGRFHSEWLSMMYPRLKLARSLLSEDGIILISIDDGELRNAGKMLEEIFGEANAMTSLVWQRKTRPSNMKISDFSSNTETLLAYSREKNNRLSIRQALSPGEVATLYSNPDNDLRGPWISKPLWSESNTNQRKSLILPSGADRTEKWFISQERLDRLHLENRIYYSSMGGMREKVFPEESPTKNVMNLILGKDYGTTERATNDLKELFGGIKVFDYPKPERLLQFLVSLLANQEDIILDFFSGSATTAHAVMQLNAEDGGNRRHIMVQLPEPCDPKSEAFKAGYKTIAEIGKERIRRAGKKILAEWQEKQAKERSAERDLLNPQSSIDNLQSPPDIGFRVLKIDSSNFNDVFHQPDEVSQDDLLLHVDNLKRGRTPEDLLFQVLLDWGVDLALPVTEEMIEGRRVFFVADDALAACFDTGLDEAFVKALAKRAPLRAVFRDSGYASDAAKINIEQIFKALSPHTELKTL